MGCSFFASGALFPDFTSAICFCFGPTTGGFGGGVDLLASSVWAGGVVAFVTKRRISSSLLRGTPDPTKQCIQSHHQHIYAVLVVCTAVSRPIILKRLNCDNGLRQNANAKKLRIRKPVKKPTNPATSVSKVLGNSNEKLPDRQRKQIP